MSKADLSVALADAGGGRRRAPQPQPLDEKAAATPQAAGAAGQPGKIETKPITVHFPKAVRSQLKMLAVQQDTTMQQMIGEAFNMLFTKYGVPEVAPVKQD